MPDRKGTCSYCNTYFGRDKVKACGQCRLVRYCSKECQVAAWKTHKPRCSNAAILRANLENDPETSMLNTALSKWVNTWRSVLHTWVLWALDLANHPEEDRLATHIMVIQLGYHPNQALRFEMYGGEIMTRHDIIARLREAGEVTDEMVATVNEQRTNDTAQIIIMCEYLVRVLWFSLRDGGAKLREKDPALSRALAEDWEDSLMDAINAGQPESAEEEHVSRAALKLVQVAPPA